MKSVLFLIKQLQQYNKVTVDFKSTKGYSLRKSESQVPKSDLFIYFKEWCFLLSTCSALKQVSWLLSL